MVSSISRCSRLSPTQMMGFIPCSSRARVFAFIRRSSSPWYWRRSEWPTMQYLTPISSSCEAETSPVYAPFSNFDTSCAPVMILASLPALSIAATFTAGTHSTVSQVFIFGRRGLSSSMKGLTSEESIFIFQLPAIIVFLYFVFIVSASTYIIYPAGMQRRGARGLRGTRGKRRRRWKCGSSYRQSQAAQRQPHCRRRRRC